jgi:hypothetical protein
MQQELIQKQEEELNESVPVCGGNLYTPVIDQANYIDEVHYTIGGKRYIEHAD